MLVTSSTHICRMATQFQAFTGEPEALSIPDDIDELTNECWNSLNADNKVSLFVRLIDLDTLETETRIINKNNQ